MMKKISYCFLFMLIFSGYAQKKKLPVVSKAEELKTVKGKQIIWQKDGAKMISIPTGSYMMGDPKPKPTFIGNDELAHRVELDGFYMDSYEVTVGQYKQFVNQSGYNYNRWNQVARYSPGDDYPMILVTWNDATAYANWAGKRLPTEAEWEYAARGGFEGRRYPWGDKEPDGSQCNYADKNTIDLEYDWADMDVDDGYAMLAPVGSFPPNSYGLYDMAGNVSEWCQDWYDSNYYNVSPAKNPPGPTSSPQGWRVMRGGSWESDSYYLRVDSRNFNSPNEWMTRFGFRCVSGLNKNTGIDHEKD